MITDIWLFICNSQQQDQKIIAIVKELQELTTKDDYKQLTFFLTLKRINDHPDFANWNALRVNLHVNRI